MVIAVVMFLLGSSTVIGTKLSSAARHHASPVQQSSILTEDGSSSTVQCLLPAVSAGKTVAVQMLNVEGWNIPCPDPEFHRLPQFPELQTTNTCAARLAAAARGQHAAGRGEKSKHYSTDQ